MIPRFAYFGTPEFSTIILNELEKKGFLPVCVVTQPDKPKGRHLILTPSPVKLWAGSRNIPVLEPSSLKDPAFLPQLTSFNCELFVVASYGKIIPQSILNIPKWKTLNVHPSLLPELRGPSPIQTAILTLSHTGVTIMRIDEEMDHGPIVAQKKVDITDWPPYITDLEPLLAHEGGALLAEIIPEWILGNIQEIPQDHEKATYCHFIKKEDAEINLLDSPEINLRKVRAYAGWPQAWTMMQTKRGLIRAVITRAHTKEHVFVIERIIPEGKKEMDYEDFKRGYL